MPIGTPRPAPEGMPPLRIGWVLEEGALPEPESGSDLWIRADAAEAATSASVAAAVASAGHVSMDAPDAGAALEIRSAGAVPVFGPASLGVLIDLLRRSPGLSAVCLPASPGRTLAEAHARLANDPALREQADAAPGLVGTLEDCQQTVAELYSAGMRDLRLRLPGTSDVPDVIAQISTLRSNALRGVRAGLPRSPAPAAPTSWGGRP
jgi:hypothetical protein